MRKPKTDTADPKLSSKAVAIGAVTLLTLATLAAVHRARDDEKYETRLLHPDSKPPEGEGWEPMNAVTHTSLYGGLMGKPVARVVWKRRIPSEDSESMSQALFLDLESAHAST
jgi:hypothetical protein